MERIDTVFDTIYKAKDGRKFRTENSCLRYEYLLDKYSSVHRVINDGEGRVNHFFYIDNAKEAEECAELAEVFLHYRCRLNPDVNYEKCVIWVPYDDLDGSMPTPFIGTINDFIDIQKDMIDAYSESLSEAEDILDEFAARSSWNIVVKISPTLSALAGKDSNCSIEVYREDGDNKHLIHNSICNNYKAAANTAQELIRLEYGKLEKV